MTKLGSEKRPVIVRVKTQERAHAVMAACTMRGWQCIAAVEPDKPEDISDFEQLLNPVTPVRSAKVGRNELSAAAGRSTSVAALRRRRLGSRRVFRPAVFVMNRAAMAVRTPDTCLRSSATSAPRRTLGGSIFAW